MEINEETLKHADHIWKFLDELAETDPEGYKQFIAKQREEIKKTKASEQEKRKKGKFLPEPVFVVKTVEVNSGISFPFCAFFNCGLFGF